MRNDDRRQRREDSGCMLLRMFQPSSFVFCPLSFVPKPETRNQKLMRGSATEKTRTSDFRRRTRVGSGERCMRRSRGACVVASRGQELEVTIRGTLAASALARHCEATGVSLLYLTIDGVVYIPCYDNNGNVTRYLNVNGGAIAMPSASSSPSPVGAPASSATASPRSTSIPRLASTSKTKGRHKRI